MTDDAASPKLKPKHPKDQPGVMALIAAIVLVLGVWLSHDKITFLLNAYWVETTLIEVDPSRPQGADDNKFQVMLETIWEGQSITSFVTVKSRPGTEGGTTTGLLDPIRSDLRLPMHLVENSILTLIVLVSGLLLMGSAGKNWLRLRRGGQRLRRM